MKKETLILDVDGVMRDIVSPIVQIYNLHFNPVPAVTYGDVREYDLSVAMPAVPNWKEFFQKYGDEVFGAARPYEEDLTSLTQMLQDRYIVHIASIQFSVKNKINTLQWLEQNRVAYDHISFLQGSKEGVHGEIILDYCIANMDPRRRSICYTQPWNSTYTGERTSSLKEFLEKNNGRM